MGVAVAAMPVGIVASWLLSDSLPLPLHQRVGKPYTDSIKSKTATQQLQLAALEGGKLATKTKLVTS